MWLGFPFLLSLVALNEILLGGDLGGSCRCPPGCHPHLESLAFHRMQTLGLQRLGHVLVSPLFPQSPLWSGTAQTQVLHYNFQVMLLRDHQH